MDQGAEATPARRRRRGRRWLGRDRRGRVDPRPTSAEGPTQLRISVSVDRADVAVVSLSGLLVRQHADGLGGSLDPVFAGAHPLFVIDLGGVTRLDPTTLATITRRAEAVRGRGAIVTIVPPGATRDAAA